LFVISRVTFSLSDSYAGEGISTTANYKHNTTFPVLMFPRSLFVHNFVLYQFILSCICLLG